MGFSIKIGHLALSLSKSIHLWILLLVSLLCGSVAAAPKVISAEPYPVGDLRITRETPSPEVYRLRVKNLNIAAGESNRARTQSWMLAGARGVMPQVEVESASFVQLRNGLVTSTTLSPPEQITQNLVRITDLGLLRQYWTYTLTITSASPVGQDGFWVLDEAVISVNIGKPSSPLDEVTTGRWDSKFGEERLSGSLLLNPDIPTDYYASDYGDPLETWSDWTRRIALAAEGDGLFRFSVYGGGVYKLSKSGVETSTGVTVPAPASQWRIYHDGQEIAAIAGIGDDGEESIYLPVVKSNLDGLQEHVYWLDASGKNAKRQPPQRLAPSEVPEENAEDSFSETAAFTVVHRELNDYNPKLKAGPGSDRWVWTDLGGNSPEQLKLTMPSYYSPTSGSKVRATIRYGFTNFPPIQPALLFLADGAEVGQTTLTVQQGTATLDVDAETLKPGDNAIALRLAYPQGTEMKRPATIQSIQTDWTQKLPAPGGEPVAFTASTSAVTTAARGLMFPEPLSKDAIVIGFQNESPFLLSPTGDTVAWQEMGYSSFIALNRQSASSVPVLEKVEQTPNFASFTTARSVIITADELASESLALKSLQERRGLSVEVYPAQLIYDAFSYGHPEPSAIRNFLRYLFYKAPGEVSEYVTLVGEASDFRGDPSLVPPVVQLNLLPASAAATPEAPQGDQQYSAAIGSDLVADFIVGRIPAATPEQVIGYAKKLEQFEAVEHGDWSRVTQFVMDDNDEFPDVVGRIISGGVAPSTDTRLLRQWDFEYVPNLRVPGKKRSWTATETLIDQFNEGIGVLNFFGHGGPNLWSHERLLHLSDLPELTNSDKLPLITCASCDNAWISYPMPPVKASMGEQMVLKADGGALGLFGPVSGASPYEHSTLVQNLMEAVSRAQIRAIGDLTFYAENMYYAVTRSSSIPDQYLLLGDPTVSIPMPRVEPALNVEALPGAVSTEKLHITLKEGSSLETAGTLHIDWGSHGDLVTTVGVQAGERSWVFDLPSDTSGGAVKAVLESSAGEARVLAGGTARVLPPLRSATPEPVFIDSKGGGYEILLPATNGEQVASNPSLYSFDLRSLSETTSAVRVVATAADGTSLAEVPRVEVTTNTAGNRFDLNFPVPLSPPATTVTLQVWPLEGSTSVAEPVTSVTYLLPVDGLAELEFVPGTARAYTADGDFVANKTVFLEAEIQNTGAVPSSHFTLQALRDNPTTGSELQTINETSSYRIEGLAPGEKRLVSFRWENAVAGSYPELYLVANRNKVVREASSDNNQIALPAVEILPMGNYVVPELEVSPSYALPGTTVSITAVAFNDRTGNPRPVTMEVGWGRTFDGETSSTRFPVDFDDGYATVSRELVVPPSFAYAFVKVNADLEIEESFGGDNTTRTETMVVVPLDEPEAKEVSLVDSIVSGVSYNLDMPFNDVLRVSPDFTSVTDYLIVDHENITTGSASNLDTPDDNAWWVAPWMVGFRSGESPGEIGFRLPLETVRADTPGMLQGFFSPAAAGSVAAEVKLGNGDWQRVTATGGGANLVADFGRMYSRNRALEWAIRPVGTEGFELKFLKFIPNAVEWKSPPLLVPEPLQEQLLELVVDTNDRTMWEKVLLEWRAGNSEVEGSIDWTPWQSVEDWRAPLSSDQYLQVRILGVPVPGEHPQLYNIRLIQQ